jgi:hypothetical protein
MVTMMMMLMMMMMMMMMMNTVLDAIMGGVRNASMQGWLHGQLTLHPSEA